jgi:hypothetical protein
MDDEYQKFLNDLVEGNLDLEPLPVEYNPIFEINSISELVDTWSTIQQPKKQTFDKKGLEYFLNLHETLESNNEQDIVRNEIRHIMINDFVRHFNNAIQAKEYLYDANLTKNNLLTIAQSLNLNNLDHLKIKQIIIKIIQNLYPEQETRRKKSRK